MSGGVWINPDGSRGEITQATASALPDPPEQPGPSQEFLQALVAAEKDRLRSEGWWECVEYVRRNYNGWLSPEDCYWLGRHNPFADTRATRPAPDDRCRKCGAPVVHPSEHLKGGQNPGWRCPAPDDQAEGDSFAARINEQQLRDGFQGEPIDPAAARAAQLDADGAP